MRTAAERRRNDWKKAIRKRRISSAYCEDHPWYKHLHQYSKGKIHCSCAICRCKTNDKHGLPGPAMNWSASDTRKMESLESQQEQEDADTLR